jgi:hypothetical protein
MRSDSYEMGTQELLRHSAGCCVRLKFGAHKAKLITERGFQRAPVITSGWQSAAAHRTVWTKRGQNNVAARLSAAQHRPEVTPPIRLVSHEMKHRSIVPQGVDARRSKCRDVVSDQLNELARLREARSNFGEYLWGNVQQCDVRVALSQ